MNSTFSELINSGGSLQTSANGFVAFGRYVLSFEDAEALGIPSDALFATDLDTSNSGSVCSSLHYVGSNASIDAVIINRVNNMVQFYANNSFMADTVVIYTLDNAPAYGNADSSITAQLVIAANSTATYTFKIFPLGGINRKTAALNVSIGGLDANPQLLAYYQLGSSLINQSLFFIDRLSSSSISKCTRACSGSDSWTRPVIVLHADTTDTIDHLLLNNCYSYRG